MRLLTLIFLLAAAPAFSQGYPSKPVRIIGAKVQGSWGQPVVIENRSGWWSIRRSPRTTFRS